MLDYSSERSGISPSPGGAAVTKNRSKVLGKWVLCLDMQEVERITRLVMESIQKQEAQGDGYMVPIGVSARHVHLTQADLEVLFGPGYQLTKKKELMGGQFASNELVTIVGLKLRAIENVRILGPCRSKSQVEISATDAIKLGVKAPVRESGDIAGSAPIALVGPKGALYLQEGCIVAARHIHMSPADARAAGVHDGDYVSVKAENERGNGVPSCENPCR